MGQSRDLQGGLKNHQSLKVQVPNNYLLAQNRTRITITQSPSTYLLSTWTLWEYEFSGLVEVLSLCKLSKADDIGNYFLPLHVSTPSYQRKYKGIWQVLGLQATSAVKASSWQGVSKTIRIFSNQPDIY